jgi:F-type H+-transporting ATPase subunit delta
MKISKTAAAAARRLFGICQTDGRMDESKLRAAMNGLLEAKPRDYLGILAALQRLVRLETERRKVLVESAVPLDAASREQVEARLRQRYGDGLVIECQVTPELIGGLRIRVGNDVMDGSVKGRLDRFAQAIR